MNVEQLSTAEQQMYVVLFPHSITNSTSKHVVVRVADWLAAYNDGRAVDRTLATEYDSYADASAHVDELNAYASLVPPVDSTPVSTALTAGAETLS